MGDVNGIFWINQGKESTASQGCGTEDDREDHQKVRYGIDDWPDDGRQRANTQPATHRLQTEGCRPDGPGPQRFTSRIFERLPKEWVGSRHGTEMGRPDCPA